MKPAPPYGRPRRKRIRNPRPTVRFRAGKRLWNPEDDELLVARYPHEPTARIARVLRRTVRAIYARAKSFGLTKTEAYLASADACRLRRGDNVGRATRFERGHVPANKGLRRPGYAPGRMAETQFKKGERRGVAARNWHPVGTILPDPEGYLRIKVREWQGGEALGFGNPRIWPFWHRHVWEQAHGLIPEGHVIAFKNRDRRDVRLDNLELVSRRELMARNTVHNLPKPLAQTIQLLGALKRQIRRRANAEEQDRRPA
jgi:hypothetical protein